MTTFLTTVNDVMVVEGIISGDDDAITSFSSTQHVASIRLAKKAVQQELAHLVANQLIPYEQTSTTLTVSARTATLASDFVRLQDEYPWLIETDASDASAGLYITEYPRGEPALRKHDLKYQENTGKPYWFYWVGGTTKTLGFYPVPASTYYYRYYYEKDVSVSIESDVTPFVSATESEVFTEACARRFKYLRASPAVREGIFPDGLNKDPVIMESRNTLEQLLRFKPPRTRYGRKYR